jgi:hypothetical protein
MHGDQTLTVTGAGVTTRIRDGTTTALFSNDLVRDAFGTFSPLAVRIS